MTSAQIDKSEEILRAFPFGEIFGGAEDLEDEWNNSSSQWLLTRGVCISGDWWELGIQFLPGIVAVTAITLRKRN